MTVRIVGGQRWCGGPGIVEIVQPVVLDHDELTSGGELHQWPAAIPAKGGAGRVVKAGLKVEQRGSGPLDRGLEPIDEDAVPVDGHGCGHQSGRAGCRERPDVGRTLHQDDVTHQSQRPKDQGERRLPPRGDQDVVGSGRGELRCEPVAQRPEPGAGRSPERARPAGGVTQRAGQ